MHTESIQANPSFEWSFEKPQLEGSCCKWSLLELMPSYMYSLPSDRKLDKLTIAAVQCTELLLRLDTIYGTIACGTCAVSDVSGCGSAASSSNIV